jgi:hypothetical protein
VLEGKKEVGGVCTMPKFVIHFHLLFIVRMTKQKKIGFKACIESKAKTRNVSEGVQLIHWWLCENGNEFSVP